MFSPFVRKKLRDIFKKPLLYNGHFSAVFLSIGEEKNVPAFEEAGTSRSADIEIWRISKHSRCPDTRRFWEYPKPFAFGIQPNAQKLSDYESFSAEHLLSS
jgi:hypothetical protein